MSLSCWVSANESSWLVDGSGEPESLKYLRELQDGVRERGPCTRVLLALKADGGARRSCVEPETGLSGVGGYDGRSGYD